MKNSEKIKKYADYLSERELAENTKRVYIRQAELFLKFMGDEAITKKRVVAYKKLLEEKTPKTATVNLYIVSLNSYLKYVGFEDCTVRTERVQKRQCPDNIITWDEYQKLLAYAGNSGRKKYYCIMRTLALTGIRISELCGCTVEALEKGKFTIRNKGKQREVYLPDKLILELKTYCGQEKIETGVIFRGNAGKPIGRSAVYKMLRHLADMVGIPEEKVHPHSFRHLFAVTYMKQYSNLFELADILGHSSLETTRLYTVTTGEEKRKRMDALDL